MKTLIILFLMALFTVPGILNAQQYQRYMYKDKVVKFTQMKNTGVFLTIGGVVLAAVGADMMYDGARRIDDHRINPSNNEDGTSAMILGFCSTVIGVCATSGGIVLWSIGGAKANDYRHKLRSISFILDTEPNQMLSLSYRF